MKTPLRTSVFAAGIVLFTFCGNASADKLCIKKVVKVGKGNKVTLAGVLSKRATCAKGTTQVLDTVSFVGPAGAQGAAGATGPTGAAGSIGATGAPGSAGSAGADGATGLPGIDGADGSIRIYGNGSRGPLTVSSGTTTLSGGNQQYTDVTISFGSTLTVSSGTVIRCTGTFDNSGTINVVRSARGAFRLATGSYLSSPTINNAVAGVSGCIAGNGDYGTRADVLLGAYFGCGLSSGSAAQLFHPGVYGGGGGGVGAGNSLAGTGGGVLTVLCKTGLMTSGTINASGEDAFSGGGGGGGVVILASPTTVKNNGTINVSGGDGAASGDTWGAGGGGGGGLVHFISPSITTVGGTVNFTAGAPGATGAAASVTFSPRFAGSAGGDGIGYGGRGGNVEASDNPDGAAGGADGLLIQTVTDPTALF